MSRAFFEKFILPKATREDLARREFILNILLVATTSLVLCGFFIQVATVLFSPLSPARYINNSFSLLAVFLIFMFFVSLFILSRKGFFCLASYLLLAAFFLLASYMAWTWGVEVQAALLFYILIIVMAGILINTRFAFIMVVISFLTLLTIHYLQINEFIHSNLYWKGERARITDVIMFATIFFIIATVSWLSNREIEKALARARRSEAELKKERDALEINVEERTRQLKGARAEKMAQLYRYAEVGRLASGLFHDLINPLNAISLSMAKLKSYEEHDGALSATRRYVDRAVSAAKKMEDFIASIRRQLSQSERRALFSLNDEIKHAVDVLSYQALKAGVTIRFAPSEVVKIVGDAIKFNQVALNLIANAIDSYEGLDSGAAGARKRTIGVSLRKADGIIAFSVSDHGVGIPEENKNKIFEPFFTTKGGAGIGIGLSMIKRIIEKDFGGSMRFESEENKGATFIITIPQTQPIN